MSISLNGTLNIYLNGTPPISLTDADAYWHVWLTPNGNAPSQGDGYQAPVFFYNGLGNNQVGIYFEPSPNQTVAHYYSFRDGISVFDISLGALDTSFPTFIAASHSDNGGNPLTDLYIGQSGAALSANTYNGDYWDASVNLDVGCWSNQEPFCGSIEGLVLIPRYLSAAEVNANYRAIYPKIGVGTGAFWPLLNNASCPVDVINGNTLTQTGSFTDSSVRPRVPWRAPEAVALR